jgi:hypothetical protein
MGAGHRCVPSASGNTSRALGVRVAYQIFGSDAAAVRSLPGLHQLVLQNGTHDVAKTFAAFIRLNMLFPTAQWYMKADDDTLLVLERLADMLLGGMMPPEEPVMAGCLLRTFFSGIELSL